MLKPSRRIDQIYHDICDARGFSCEYGYWISGEPKNATFYQIAVVQYLDEQSEGKS